MQITPERIQNASRRQDLRGRMVDAETLFTTRSNESAAEALVRMYWYGDPPHGILPDTRGVATVNHGRWLVECPWCSSASMASRDDHRFFCTACGNDGTGKWIVVDWPANAQQAEIVLADRPSIEARSFDPRVEDVGTLIGENLVYLPGEGDV